MTCRTRCHVLFAIQLTVAVLVITALVGGVPAQYWAPFSLAAAMVTSRAYRNAAATRNACPHCRPDTHRRDS